MNRSVEPEWLDALPTSDPGATASRRDLERLNFLMGHAGILARCWRVLELPGGGHLAELGAGDGTLCLRLLQLLPPHLRPHRVSLVDRQPLVSGDARSEFEHMGCEVTAVEADAMQWLRSAPRVDLILANLFLHHFHPDELALLLQGMAERTGIVIALEPRRSAISLGASRLVGWIGCNDVTRHDAVASVRAGFAAREISQAWPKGAGWQLEERKAGLFSHLFTARQIGSR